MSTQKIRTEVKKSQPIRLQREARERYVYLSHFKSILLDVLDEIDSVSEAAGGEAIYALLSKDSNQSAVGVDTDISFQTSVIGGTGMSFSTPTLTLPSGHIFMVEGQLTVFNFSGSSSNLQYNIVDDTNTVITDSVTGTVNNVANNGLGGDGKAWAIVDTTGGSVDIKLRVTGASGTATIDVEGTGLRVYKI